MTTAEQVDPPVDRDPVTAKSSRGFRILAAIAALGFFAAITWVVLAGQSDPDSVQPGPVVAGIVPPTSVGLKSFVTATANGGNHWAPQFTLQTGDEFTFSVDTSGAARVLQEVSNDTPQAITLVQSPNGPAAIAPGTVFVTNTFATGADTMSAVAAATDTGDTVQMWTIKEGSNGVLDPLGATPASGPRLASGETVAAISPRSVPWDSYHWVPNTIVTVKNDGTLTQYSSNWNQGSYSSSVIVAPPGQGPAGFAAPIDSIVIGGQDDGGYLYTWQFSGPTSGSWNVTAMLGSQGTWTGGLPYETDKYPSAVATGEVPTGVFVPNLTTGQSATANPSVFVMTSAAGSTSVTTLALDSSNLWAKQGEVPLAGSDLTPDVGYGAFNVNASTNPTVAYYQLNASGALTLYDATSGKAVPGGAWFSGMIPQNKPAVGTLAACNCYAGYGAFSGITASGNLAFYGPSNGSGGGYDAAVVSSSSALGFALATPSGQR